MNEIELAVLVDHLEHQARDAVDGGSGGFVYSPGAGRMTDREVELANAELARRGAPGKVMPLTWGSLTASDPRQPPERHTP